MDSNNSLTNPERILGWDLLRGLCAFAVASYHLMLWLDAAAVHTLGSYGVYLFFVLSGASLAYNYVGRFESGQVSVLRFLRVRYWRLAPLYLALMLLALPWKLFKDGATFDLFVTYLLNATFLFGFFNPSVNAVLVGGWSLGIEAIFYLLFPWLMLAFVSTRRVVGVFAGLVLLQISWIALTLGQPGGDVQNTTAYFQAPAFAAYFMGGCILGVAKRNGCLAALRHDLFGVLILLAGFALMVLVNPARAGDEIASWRGFVLGACCFGMVYIASKIPAKRGWGKLAAYCGDATFGLYLLHPVIFFGCVHIVFPRMGIANPSDWPFYARFMFGCGVMGLAFGLALLSERYFEKPVREYFKPKSQPKSTYETTGYETTRL